MTTTEFKTKYPQFSHLEGDDLWDKMTKVLLESNNTLYADPNQVKVYNNAILYNGISVRIEDTSTTRWLDKNGNLVRVGEVELSVPESFVPENSHTTYGTVIWDVTKT